MSFLSPLLNCFKADFKGYFLDDHNLGCNLIEVRKELIKKARRGHLEIDDTTQGWCKLGDELQQKTHGSFFTNAWFWQTSKEKAVEVKQTVVQILTNSLYEYKQQKIRSNGKEHTYLIHRKVQGCFFIAVMNQTDPNLPKTYQERDKSEVKVSENQRRTIRKKNFYTALNKFLNNLPDQAIRADFEGLARNDVTDPFDLPEGAPSPESLLLEYIQKGHAAFEELLMPLYIKRHNEYQIECFKEDHGLAGEIEPGSDRDNLLKACLDEIKHLPPNTLLTTEHLEQMGRVYALHFNNSCALRRFQKEALAYAFGGNATSDSIWTLTNMKRGFGAIADKVFVNTQIPWEREKAIQLEVYQNLCLNEMFIFFKEELTPERYSQLFELYCERLQNARNFEKWKMGLGNKSYDYQKLVGSADSGLSLFQTGELLLTKEDRSNFQLLIDTKKKLEFLKGSLMRDMIANNSRTNEFSEKKKKFLLLKQNYNSALKAYNAKAFLLRQEQWERFFSNGRDADLLREIKDSGLYYDNSLPHSALSALLSGNEDTSSQIERVDRELQSKIAKLSEAPDVVVPAELSSIRTTVITRLVLVQPNNQVQLRLYTFKVSSHLDADFQRKLQHSNFVSALERYPDNDRINLSLEGGRLSVTVDYERNPLMTLQIQSRILTKEEVKIYQQLA